MQTCGNRGDIAADRRVGFHELLGKQAAEPNGAQKCTSVYTYLIKPSRKAFATACVRFTASSFLVARFR